MIYVHKIVIKTNLFRGFWLKHQCFRRLFQHLWLSWRQFFWQCRCFRWILHQLRNHQLWLLIHHLRRKLLLRRFWWLRLIIRFLRFFLQLRWRTRLFWLLCQRRLRLRFRRIRNILPKLRLLLLWLRLRRPINYPFCFLRWLSLQLILLILIRFLKLLSMYMFTL